MPIGTLHHIGLVVPDLDRAAATVERVYGLTVTVFDELDYACRIGDADQVVTHRLAMTAGPGPHVELIRAVPGSTVWAAAPGIHHVGYAVDDLAAASARLAASGAPLVMGCVDGDTFPAGSCYHRDPLGQIVELLDRATAARLDRKAAAE